MVLVVLPACGDDPSHIDWSIVFASDALRDRAQLVEAKILEGGCTAGSTFYETELRPGAAQGPTPGELPDGRWGFSGRARDGNCTFFAQGCSELQLPESSGRVVTTLEAAGEDPECSADACVDGECGPEPECELGTADCNGEPGDGCEANLYSRWTCGDCDVECAAVCGISDGRLQCLDECPPGTPTGCDGSCVDLTSDPQHCGDCDTSCLANHAQGACQDSVCVLTGCDDDWGDCDDDASTGCETDLTTLTDCGDCDVECDLPYASETCDSGSCQVDHCFGDRGNCDGQAWNGCEDEMHEPPNCGACGQDCEFNGTIASCIDAECVVSGCTGSYQDCDGQGFNGCEANLSRDESNCGECGTECGFREECRSSVCQPD